MMRTWVVTSPRVVGIECYREIKFTAGSLALLYGYVHRSVKKICRDAPDRAARAPHAVHPAAPGASAHAAGEHCAKTTLNALYLAGTC